MIFGHDLPEEAIMHKKRRGGHLPIVASRAYLTFRSFGMFAKPNDFTERFVSFVCKHC